MSLETVQVLLLGWVAFTAAALSPGPNMVAVVSRSLGAGLRAGLAVAGGIAIGAFIWALAAAVGLSQIFVRVPGIIPVLSFAGGGYLLYLGYRGIRSALFASQSFITPSSSVSIRSDVFHGLTVTLSNPKVALLWASLATVVADGLQSVLAIVVFAGVTSLLGLIVYGGYGLLFSVGVAQRIYRRFSRLADAMFGGIFSVLGGLLIGHIKS